MSHLSQKLAGLETAGDGAIESSLALPPLRPATRWQKLGFAVTDFLLLRAQFPFFLIESAIAWLCFVSLYRWKIGLGVSYPLGMAFHAELRAGIPPHSLAILATFILFAFGLDLFKTENRYVPASFLRIMGLAWLASLSVLSLFPDHTPELFAMTVTALAHALARVMGAIYLRFHPKRMLILGPTTETSLEIRKFCAEKPGFRYASYFRCFSVENPPGELPVAKLIVTGPAFASPALTEQITRALEHGCNFVDEVKAYETILGRYPVSGEIVGLEMIAKGTSLSPLDAILKRSFDVVAGSLGLIVTLPLFFIIAIVIRWTSRGPVFFIQARLGRNRKMFHIIKFRTMVDRPSSDRASFTLQDDARVTRVGKFLRRTHFDELPQLFNILKGEMSLVGPRPEMLQFAQRMVKQIPACELRYWVRPGLTGLAQINQGYAMDTIDDTLVKLSYDLYYLRHHSFMHDIALIVRTAFFIWGDTSHKNR